MTLKHHHNISLIIFLTTWKDTFLGYYLDFLLILEPSLANDDVLDSPPISKLLLKHRVVLEELLRLVFGDSVQSVLIDHPNTFKLRRKVTSNQQLPVCQETEGLKLNSHKVKINVSLACFRPPSESPRTWRRPQRGFLPRVPLRKSPPTSRRLSCCEQCSHASLQNERTWSSSSLRGEQWRVQWC